MKKLNINVLFASIVAIFLFTTLIYTKTSNNEISVVGRCSKQVKKDRFALTATIKNLDKNSSISLSKTLSTYKQVSEYLKEVSTSNPDIEVETTDYSTEEKREWNEKLKKDEKIGIEALISLKIITSKPELLSKIAFDFGKFNDVYTSKFTNFVSDLTYDTETNNCIKEAMLDAKAQAEVIASSLGQSVGKMIYANYYSSTNSYNTGKMFLKASALAVDNVEEGALDIEPATIFSGSTKLNVSIDVKFELK